MSKAAKKPIHITNEDPWKAHIAKLKARNAKFSGSSSGNARKTITKPVTGADRRTITKPETGAVRRTITKPETGVIGWTKSESVSRSIPKKATKPISKSFRKAAPQPVSWNIPDVTPKPVTTGVQNTRKAVWAKREQTSAGSSTPSKVGVYDGNYWKARKLAIARSGGKCQFCGMREAKEGHHWAYPKSNYPHGDNVQGHDLTALCKPCHELATVIRDWVGKKDADFDILALDLADSNNFFEKREVFSYWLFPEEDETTNHAVQSYAAEPRRQNPSNCLAWLILIPIGAALWTLFGNN